MYKQAQQISQLSGDNPSLPPGCGFEPPPPPCALAAYFCLNSMPTRHLLRSFPIHASTPNFIAAHWSRHYSALCPFCLNYVPTHHLLRSFSLRVATPCFLAAHWSHHLLRTFSFRTSIPTTHWSHCLLYASTPVFLVDHPLRVNAHVSQRLSLPGQVSTPVAQRLIGLFFC